MAQTTLHDYLQQAEHAISSGRLEDALEHCQQILKQFPDALAAQRLLGKVYLEQGYLEEAQQTFDWVLTNDPENVLTYCDRAVLSERMSDVDTALDCYQQAYELSRGDGRIRREFNQISARAGQAGFMFSRAGLARLYMRGDLLAEAIQEWEVVLASGPERLDARLGLMETCWREGKNERAEQLARQILQDVPGCLKALVLLAFLVASKDLQEARQYIQKAEALDPELSLAHELFKDTQVSLPSHPLWQFLSKGPVFITEGAAKDEVVVPASADNVKDALVAVNALPQWGDMNNWNGVDTLDNPLLPTPVEASTYVKSNTQNEVKREEQPTPTQNYTLSASSSSSSGDSWERLTNDNASFASNSWSASVEEKQASAPPSWLNMLTQSEPQQTAAPAAKVPEPREATVQAVELHDTSESRKQEETYQPAYATGLSDAQDPVQADEEDEEESFFSPEWLKSLGAASFDADSPSREISAVSPIVPAPQPTAELTSSASQLSAASSVEPAQAPEPEVIAQPTFEEWQAPMAPPETNWEASGSQSGATFEPWLATYQQSAPYVYEEMEPWQPEPEPGEPSLSAFSVPEAEAVPDEQSVLATLEGLESDLLSQGFVPLEPNSLSTIAQNQQEASAVPVAPTANTQEAYLEEAAHSMQEEAHEEAEPTLSSAFAELSSPNPYAAGDDLGDVADAAQFSRQQQTDYSTQQAEEPSWLASFRMTPAPEPTIPQAPPVIRRTTTPLQPAASMQSNYQQTEKAPEQKVAPRQPTQESQPSAPAPLPVPPARVDALPGPVFTPTYEPAINSKKLPDPVKVPSARIDVGSDVELEITMKRPAIHLQALQAQRNTAFSSDHASATSKARSGERPAVSKPGDSTMSHRDRLVKGYQHQLVGDYDEAMQEYRILIRNASELLSEVVSNLRALLKLAPNYSAGYRVLGDAYMRQGEYLQAMEAYNKALTMAKKAKS